MINKFLVNCAVSQDSPLFLPQVAREEEEDNELRLTIMIGKYLAYFSAEVTVAQKEFAFKRF